MNGLLRLRPRRAAAAAVMAEAEEFLRAFHADGPGAGDAGRRITEMRRAVSSTGTYEHTAEELLWAARVAWRHAARCSGRDKWKILRLRDRRSLTAPEEVAAETAAHLREATNRGNVRSFITVFAPDTPGRPGPRIINGQAVRYAGYRQPDGTVTGDPLNAGLTALAASLGWKGAGGRFDVLPLIVRGPGGTLRMFDLPADAVLEVPLTHPQFGWFARLGLRWYAVPVIADMYLDAGGIRYPCAPFSGWYQASSEVGVRNLGDRDRYDMLPAVAKGMGLDTSSLSTLWRDRAALELATAVHHSYRKAGVMVTDHQSEAARFASWVGREEEAGREVRADWAWVNPPSMSTTPAFHRTYKDEGPALKPGYFRHEDFDPACDTGG